MGHNGRSKRGHDPPTPQTLSDQTLPAENRGFRHAQLVLRASLKQGVPELPEDDPFDTPSQNRSVPDLDLSTPGYVVEFTWRTVGVREIFHGGESPSRHLSGGVRRIRKHQRRPGYQDDRSANLC